jgi:hypothetical protein
LYNQILFSPSKDIGLLVVLAGGIDDLEIEVGQELHPAYLLGCENFGGHEVFQRPVVRKDFDFAPYRHELWSPSAK